MGCDVKLQSVWKGECTVRLDNGTAWPRAALDSDERGLAGVAWRLQYGNPTQADMQTAASVMSAYASLVWKPKRLRDAIVAALRAAEDDQTGS
jgi:hypothetical protein